MHAAHTTLYNSINAFNALNFNKFVENVTSLCGYEFVGNRRKYRSLELVVGRGQ